jgi:hypothetical protein
VLPGESEYHVAGYNELVVAAGVSLEAGPLAVPEETSRVGVLRDSPSPCRPLSTQGGSSIDQRSFGDVPDSQGRVGDRQSVWDSHVLAQSRTVRRTVVTSARTSSAPRSA